MLVSPITMYLSISKYPDPEIKYIKESAVAERKIRYTYIFLVLKVCDNENAIKVNPYVWYSLSCRVKSISLFHSVC